MFARLLLVNLQQAIIQASGGKRGSRMEGDNRAFHQLQRLINSPPGLDDALLDQSVGIHPNYLACSETGQGGGLGAVKFTGRVEGFKLNH